MHSFQSVISQIESWPWKQTQFWISLLRKDLWTPNCWHQVSFWGTPKNLGYYSDAANMNNYWGTLSASYFAVVNHNFTQTTIEVKCSTISYAMRAIWTNHQHCRYLDKCHLNPAYILYNRGTSLTCNCHNLIRIVFLPTLCLNHFL